MGYPKLKESNLSSIKAAAQKLGWSYYVIADSFNGIEGIVIGTKGTVRAVAELCTGEEDLAPVAGSNEVPKE